MMLPLSGCCSFQPWLIACKISSLTPWDLFLSLRGLLHKLRIRKRASHPSLAPILASFCYCLPQNLFNLILDTMLWNFCTEMSFCKLLELMTFLQVLFIKITPSPASSMKGWYFGKQLCKNRAGYHIVCSPPPLWRAWFTLAMSGQISVRCLVYWEKPYYLHLLFFSFFFGFG